MSSPALTTADVLKLPDSPQRRAILAQLRPDTHSTQPARLVGNGDVLSWSATVAMVTLSEPNVRGHHMVKAKRAKAQHATVRDVMRRSLLALPPLPATITLVRIASRLLDTDNLGTALKAVRDEVADTYGVDDGVGERDGRYTWVPAQRIGPVLAVEVRIERKVVSQPRNGRRATTGMLDDPMVTWAPPTP